MKAKLYYHQWLPNHFNNFSSGCTWLSMLYLYFLGGVWKTTLLPLTISMLLSSSDSRKSAAYFHCLMLKMIRASKLTPAFSTSKTFSQCPDLANSCQLMAYWSVGTILRPIPNPNFGLSQLGYSLQVNWWGSLNQLSKATPQSRPSSLPHLPPYPSPCGPAIFLAPHSSAL